MSKIVIKLAPSEKMVHFYMGFGTAEAQAMIHNGEYQVMPAIESDLTGSEAAEEAFDLTNNPSRQAERVQKYGRHRSVSVGDVVEVDGESFLCAGVGWKHMPSPKSFVVYSPNESSLSDGAGFWSNEQGWVDLDSATRFSELESVKLSLPASTGMDARWVDANEALLSYSGQAQPRSSSGSSLSF